MTQNNSQELVQGTPAASANSNTVTIDIGALFSLFMRHIVLIGVVTLLFGAVSFFYYSNHTEPTYTSWFTGYVNKSTVERNGVDLTGESLVSTYAAVITSKVSLESAAEEVGIDKSYKSLKSMVSTNISEDTQIIYVYVSGKDPNEVFLLAGALASTAQEQVSRVVDGTSMRVMDEPDVPEANYSISVTKRTAIGAGIGFVLVYGVLFLLYFLDDRIQDEKTIEETFGLVLLGTIPDFDRDDDNKYYSRKYYKRRYYDKSRYYEHRTGQHEKQETGGQV